MLIDKNRRFCLKNGMIDSEIKIKVEKDLTKSTWYHEHEFIEIAYCESGVGKHIVDGVEYEIKQGDVFLFNSGILHKLYSNFSQLSLINVMVVPEVLSDAIDPKNFVNEFYEKIYCGGKVEQKLDSGYLYVSGASRENYGILFSNIFNEYNRHLPCYVDVLQKEVQVLVIKLFRDYVSNFVRDGLTTAQCEMIEQIMRSINENVCTLNKIDDVMEQVGYNKIYFNRLFEKYTGMSISRYLKKRKMDYACSLLINTNYTIEHICELIGYNDVKNFYKTFKAMEKITPGAYREKAVRNYKKV